MTTTPFHNQSLESFVQEQTAEASRPAPVQRGEAEADGPVAPGQEELAAEILGSEEKEEQKEELILGKFKTADDLAKAYKELERKIGQPKEPEPQAMTPGDYSKEWATDTFGAELAERFDQAGFNPIELSERLASGDLELDAAAQELAEASGLSPMVAETYLRGLHGGGEQTAAMTEADQAQVLEKFGGEEKFRDLARWAKANVPEAQVEAYNKVLNTGNREAVELALWAFQSLRDSAEGKQSDLVEPKLISGSAPSSSGTKFESQQQAIEAMNKRNSTGERLYEVDEAYRAKVAQMIANSNW